MTYWAGSESRAEKSSQTSLLFPIPGTPTRVTSCEDRSRCERATPSRSALSSSLRPTSGAPPRKAMSTPSRAFGAMGSHAGTGSALPFATTGSASWCSMTFSVSRWVASSTRIPSGGAALCSREAVLSTSPAASCSPCSGRAFRLTSASPVAAPMRTDSPSDGSSAFSSEIASRTASAARTARSASSSWRGRRPEDGDDRVADELLHGAAEALELGLRPRVVRSEEAANVLRVETLRACS